MCDFPHQPTLDILEVATPVINLNEGKGLSLSIVVPVFNECEVLREFHARLVSVLGNALIEVEIIYVNDGSMDSTQTILTELHRDDHRVVVIQLSRNFGKESAMSAGLDAAQGDAVVVIDADLQDPPEQIPSMLQEWQAGYDVVLMRRRSRAQETWLKRATARAFYRMIGRMATIEIPEDVGDFRLLSRRAVLALRQLPERSRFMKGLFAWIGFPCRELQYDRDGRFAGQSKWNYWRLWNFALEGVTSFSAAPLKLASYVGLGTAVLAFAYGSYFVMKTLLFGDPVQGFPTLVTIVLFLGGLQLMALGIIGEYLARMFVEVKARPLYLIQRKMSALRPLRREGEIAEE